MKKLAVLTSILVASSIFSISSQADAPRRDFSKIVTRTTPAGTITRTIDQHRTDNGFTRSSSLTTPDGRTAERDTTVTNDQETQTHTHETSGTRLNGDTYSSQRTTERTDNGYHQVVTHTNANGKTVTKESDIVVDKDPGTISKQTTITGADGETHSKSVVIQ